MDIIAIEDLQCHTVIGEYDWERAVRQAIVLDLQLHVDIRPAAQSDDLRHAVDYAQVCVQLKEFIAAKQCYLIETLAESIAQFILDHFAIKQVDLSLTKPLALADAGKVIIKISREA